MTQSYTLEVQPEECALIAGTLSNLPYRQVAPLIDKLKTQCKAQDDERDAAAAKRQADIISQSEEDPS